MDDQYLHELDVRGCGVRFEHRFVDAAPQTLEPDVLYVSIRHKSVLHLCACGCGQEVVTPLAPHRWQVIFDGETVSLEPSVGNSVLACRSHYFITNNEVDWYRPMTDESIARARRRDERAVEEAFTPAKMGRGRGESVQAAQTPTNGLGRPEPPPRRAMAARSDWWARFRERLKRWLHSRGGLGGG